MTREEAKKELSKLIFELGFEDNVDDKVCALNMAIQALSQEPCDDAISREAVCDYIADYVNDEYSTQAECEMADFMIEGIQHLPSVTHDFIKPRDKAHWIIQSKGVWTHLYKCSKCGGGVMACELDMPQFCGHCGAMMEGK